MYITVCMALYLGIRLWLLALIILTTLYLLLIFTKDKVQFKKWSSRIELFSILFAVWFSIFSIELAVDSLDEANDTAQRQNQLYVKTDSIYKASVKNNKILDTLSNRLTKLPAQLDQFSNSLEKLNEVISVQESFTSRNIQELKSNIANLNTGVTSLQQYINTSISQLSKTSSLTDQQLKIWEGQQDIVKKEYARRPKLDLYIGKLSETDSTAEIKQMAITNSGNIEANISVIMFYVPKKSIITFEVDNTYKVDEDSIYYFYQLSMNNIERVMCIYEDQRIAYDVRIKMKKIEKIPAIPYIIYYSSKYKSGKESRNLYLKNKSLEEILEIEKNIISN